MKLLSAFLAFIALSSVLYGQTKPTALTTGPTGTLTPSGPITTSSNGQIIEDLEITGYIVINHSNVTVRNCLINVGGNFWGILVNSPGTNTGTVVEDCEFTGSASAQINGGQITISRCHFHDSVADAIKLNSGNNTVEDSFFTRLGDKSDPTKHADGIQWQGAGANQVIEGNNFDMIYNEDGFYNHVPMMLQADTADITGPIYIRNNWINGGGYSVHIREKNGYQINDVVYMTDNIFGDDYVYAPWVVDLRTSGDQSRVYIACNTDEATGAFLGGQDAITDCSPPIGGTEATAPAFTPSSGAYNYTAQVAMDTPSAGTTIYYTTDGSTPDNTDTVYTAPVSVSTTTTLKAFATGGAFTDSPVTTSIYDYDPYTIESLWESIEIDEETGTFTFTCNVTPDQGNVNLVFTLAPAHPQAWDDNAVLVRFNTSGEIDARNGGSYAADATLAYSAAVSYGLSIAVNISAKTYSVDVTPDGGGTTTIATDYAFRTEHAAATALSHAGWYTATGSGTVDTLASTNDISGIPALYLSNAVLNTAGTAITATISGGGGTYTPTSGITNLAVRNSGVANTITSTSISGTVLTTNLTTAIKGWELVFLDFPTNSNLTDGTNTSIGQVNITVNNQSEVWNPIIRRSSRSLGNLLGQ